MPPIVLRTLCAAIVLAVASPAGAETVKCQRAIARAAAKLVQVKANELRKCEESIVRGKSAGPCPSAATTTKIAKASAAAAKSIAGACGGDDRQCGADLANEDTPASLGWPSACPGFESTGCSGSMNDCSGIAQCLDCVSGAAVDQGIALLYDSLVLPSVQYPFLNKCQVTLGRATIKYLAGRSRLLQKCWDARLKGQHALVCPDVNDISHSLLANKISAAICKACGGSDGLCNGANDFTRAAIGFPFDCPAVQPVDSNPCSIWTPSNGLFDIVQCALCVARFKTECTDRAAVPQFVAYPPGCGGGPQPTPTPQACHGTGGLACAGDCPPSQNCLPIEDSVCGCFPDGSQPCLESGYPVCNGTCPGGDTCGTSAIIGGQCLCGNPPCGQAPYPTCGGDCPGTDQCVPGKVSGLDTCWCVPAGNVCGAGTCPPFGTCPPGQVCSIPSCTCGAP